MQLYLEAVVSLENKVSKWATSTTNKIGSRARFSYDAAKRDFHDLRDTDLAYIAGVVDGEGCIHSSYPLNGSRLLTLTVTMIHRPTIETLAELMQSSVYSMKDKRNKGGRRRFSTTIKGVRAMHLLEKLLPYLVAKHEEAATAIALVFTAWEIEPGKAIPEKVRLKREVLGKKLRELKLREFDSLDSYET